MDDKGKLLYRRRRRPTLCPGEQHQAGGERGGLGPVGSRLDGHDQRVRERADDSGTLDGDLILYGRGSPFSGIRCYATDSTLPGVCDSDPFAPYRALAESLSARGLKVVTENASATEAGSMAS